eukprot:4203868-Pleurochrysis_carterae.AAC.1
MGLQHRLIAPPAACPLAAVLVLELPLPVAAGAPGRAHVLAHQAVPAFRAAGAASLISPQQSRWQRQLYQCHSKSCSHGHVEHHVVAHHAVAHHVHYSALAAEWTTRSAPAGGATDAYEQEPHHHRR